MATHKVPQDVEADDKLVGPLSLRQFIFTILGLGFGYLTFFFFTQVHPISAIIWLLPTFVFLTLGLYQRKDQPVEIFLASALQFYLGKKKRVWNQEGFEERVIITAPPKIEKHYTKGFTENEVLDRLGNLSRLMDTRGWASKQVDEWQNPALANTAESDRLVNVTAMNYQPPVIETQPVDVLDETSGVSKSIDQEIKRAEVDTHNEAEQIIQQARQSSQATQSAEPPRSSPTATTEPDYTSDPTILDKVAHAGDQTIHQKVIMPASKPNLRSIYDRPEPTRSKPKASERVEKLAEIDDVDIQTLSGLANNDGDEVEIKLH